MDECVAPDRLQRVQVQRVWGSYVLRIGVAAWLLVCDGPRMEGIETSQIEVTGNRRRGDVDFGASN